MATITHGNSDPDSTWLTVPEAAGRLRVGKRVIYDAVGRGQLRAARLGAGRRAFRIKLAWLTDYAERCASPVEIAR